jgi:hypothetical protein
MIVIRGDPCLGTLGRTNERPVRKTVGVVVRPEQVLDAAPEPLVGRALAVEDGGAAGGGLMLEGRQEDGSGAAWVKGHQSFSPSGAT